MATIWRTTRALTIALGLTAVGTGCSQIADSSIVQGAKNQAVCAVLSQPLQSLNDSVDTIDKNPAGFAGLPITGLAGSLDGSFTDATGQLAVDVTTLQQSMAKLIEAIEKGSPQPIVHKRVLAVKDAVASVQADCAA